MRDPRTIYCYCRWVSRNAVLAAEDTLQVSLSKTCRGTVCGCHRVSTFTPCTSYLGQIASIAGQVFKQVQDQGQRLDKVLCVACTCEPCSTPLQTLHFGHHLWPIHSLILLGLQYSTRQGSCSASQTWRFHETTYEEAGSERKQTTVSKNLQPCAVFSRIV